MADLLTCEVCRKPFRRKSDRGRTPHTCGPRCAKKRWYSTRPLFCPGCGGDMAPAQRWNGLLCSKDCPGRTSMRASYYDDRILARVEAGALLGRPVTRSGLIDSFGRNEGQRKTAARAVARLVGTGRVRLFDGDRPVLVPAKEAA